MPFETLPKEFEVNKFEATLYESTNPTAPTTIIATDQEWGVKVHWETSGHLSNHLRGKWFVAVSIESIGAGPEEEVGYQQLDLKPGPDPVKYEADIKVPAGKVTVPNHRSMPFKLVTTVSFMWDADHPGPMAGYVDGPIVQFYVP